MLGYRRLILLLLIEAIWVRHIQWGPLHLHLLLLLRVVSAMGLLVIYYNSLSEVLIWIAHLMWATSSEILLKLLLHFTTAVYWRVKLIPTKATVELTRVSLFIGKRHSECILLHHASFTWVIWLLLVGTRLAHTSVHHLVLVLGLVVTTYAHGGLASIAHTFSLDTRRG